MSSSYKVGKASLKEAKKAGYKDAFLVAFKNGERISVKEAIKLLNDWENSVNFVNNALLW